MDYVEKIIDLVGDSTVGKKEPIVWGEIEEAMGLALPEDYKILASKYFTVNLGSISLITPRAGTPGDPDLLVATRESEEIFREFLAEDPFVGDVPQKMDGTLLEGYPRFPDFYPTVPGLLKWGDDFIGDEFYWYVDGPSSEWKILAKERDGWWCEHEMSVSEYIYKAAIRVLDCEIVAKSFDDENLFVEWPWPND
ncbi:hypothetical protein [Nocardiopsis sp. LOL_012]|uniref:hypothetical protein n=1 Tax=Nocardiopsis sp. LOL_012 TaxID=3345409 RepID=UPI003A837C86